MSEHTSEQSGADFSIARDFPALETVLTSKDLQKFDRLGIEIQRRLKKKGVLIRNPGTWQMAIGYLDKIFGGLQKDSLRGYSFIDVGGGSYKTQGFSYGPDLAKAFNYFGADVTIVDPVANPNDFLPDELKHVVIEPETVENFVQRNVTKKVSMLTSASFFGSPNKEVNTPEECLATIANLRDMAKVSDVQLHVVNNLDHVNWQLLASQLNDSSVEHGLQVKYLGGATLLANSRKDMPLVDLIIIDNRLPRQ